MQSDFEKKWKIVLQARKRAQKGVYPRREIQLLGGIEKASFILSESLNKLAAKRRKERLEKVIEGLDMKGSNLSSVETHALQVLIKYARQSVK